MNELCGVERMKAAEIARLFEPWRRAHARTAWKPVVTSDQSTATLSWFGGVPTEGLEREWPTCRECRAPMSFFVQLAFEEFPAESSFPFKDGVLQVFYCSTDDGSCETWAPFSGTHALRVVPSNPNLVSLPPEIEALPRARVTGWSPFEDSPHPEEHESLGVAFSYDFKKNRVDVHCQDPVVDLTGLDIDLNVAEAISSSEPGDKLGGWPYWVQGAEYPACPNCEEKMQLLLQIDSEDNLKYMFGDVGCAHITYCPKHLDILAFVWACA